jgi:hypothetical protein
MEKNNRKQMLYQKTDFNSHKICQLPGMFICCKCKKNNIHILSNQLSFTQLCLFCGTPNYVKTNI